MERWSSVDAADAAVFRTVEEARQTKKRGRSSRSNPEWGRVIEVYCGFLTEREQLLDHSTLQQMLGDVVTESSLWGPLVGEVVKGAQAVVSAMKRLLHREPMAGHNNSGRLVGFFYGGSVRQRQEWAFEKRKHILPAIESLRIYSRPPAPAAVATKQEKRRDRKGGGGRPKKYPVEFVRDVQAARSREEKAYRRSKERLPPKAEWLRIYCRNRGIDTAKMFPSKDEAVPEPWDVRAKRFWKAVAAREGREDRDGN